MEYRNFNDDFNNSNKIKPEWIKVFKKAFGEDCNIQFKDDKISQCDFGTDALITTKKGRRFSIEYKTRRCDYFKCKDYLLEIAHHRYTDKSKKNKISTVPGRLYKGTFDYIFYATISEHGNKIIEVLGFSAFPFKSEEFKSEYNNMPNGWAQTRFDGGIYQLTLNKIVSKDFIVSNALKSWYWVEE